MDPLKGHPFKEPLWIPLKDIYWASGAVLGNGSVLRLFYRSGPGARDAVNPKTKGPKQ